MAQIKILTTFSGLTKYHDAGVARSVISLKMVYKDLVNITIVSEEREYLQSAHGFANMLYPVTVADKKFVEKLDFKGSISFVFGNDHPDIQWLKSIGSKVYILPPIVEIPMQFNSPIFGSVFTYPKYSYMKDVLFENGLIPKVNGVIV
ncbi:MAG: hypothetical protein E6R13_05400 [Spirochaetes bacterium]|nr:MAG: hypothetical protein E6R13_05400 [Spirochaetota bacterium]